jgi:hypothetical protein
MGEVEKGEAEEAEIDSELSCPDFVTKGKSCGHTRDYVPQFPAIDEGAGMWRDGTRARLRCETWPNINDHLSSSANAVSPGFWDTTFTSRPTTNTAKAIVPRSWDVSYAEGRAVLWTA